MNGSNVLLSPTWPTTSRPPLLAWPAGLATAGTAVGAAVAAAAGAGVAAAAGAEVAPAPGLAAGATGWVGVGPAGLAGSAGLPVGLAGAIGAQAARSEAATPPSDSFRSVRRLTLRCPIGSIIPSDPCPTQGCERRVHA
jgi:hypothetical protein